MNIFTQLIGVAVNIIMSPFDENSIIRPLIPPSCDSVLFKMGENELRASLAPKGYCSSCCPIRTGIDIRFVLYTKTDPQKGKIIQPHKPGAATRAGLNSTNPTEIYIHGFTEPSPGQSGRTIADAYLSRSEDFNVILMDWSELATFPWYRPAVRNVKAVAEMLRNFLEVFNDSGEIPISTVHVIGFSLGSHIASFTGKRLRKGLRIPRITALDPALPEYSIRDASRRLSKDDADFVDVIHTDAGVFGLPIPVGHADFYPNGGRALQPGCQPSYLVQIRLVDQILACSHVRAWRLYAESVRNSGAFPATRCRIWRGPNKKCEFNPETFMGYWNNNRTLQGQFYLLTRHKAPFSKTAGEQKRWR